MSILFAILNILLIILKIIGLLLAFILLLVFIILAVEIKYNIYFKLDKDNKKELEIRVTWLGKAIKYWYKLGENAKLSIFNYFLIGGEKNKKKKPKQKSKKRKNRKTSNNKKKELIKEEVTKEDKIYVEQIKVDKKEIEFKEDIKIEKDIEKKIDEKIDEKIVETHIEKEKIKNENKEENKDKDEEKAKKPINESINDFLEYPDKSDIIKLSIGYLGKLLKILKPKYFKVNGVLGFESPDITGQVLGIIAIIRGQTGLDINIVGDFEKEIKAVEIEMYGAVSLLKILIITIRFVLRKPIWKIVKKII